MTIGMNKILNKLNSEINAGKFTQKDEFSVQDFSIISNQFKNIFNTQFDKQFQNQFDYKQVFSGTYGKNEFMSDTASKMSDEKYYSQSYTFNNNNDLGSQAKNIESPKSIVGQKQDEHLNTEKNKENEEVQAKTKGISENSQNTTILAQILAMMTNMQKFAQANAEKNLKNEKELSSLTAKSNLGKTKEKGDKQLVSIKATELTKLEEFSADDALVQKVDVKLKDVKIEKLDLKIKHKETKQTKDNVQTSTEANKKTEDTPKEDVQNKVSLERLSANVIEKKSGNVSELDSLLAKNIIKKADAMPKHNVVSNEKIDNKIQFDAKNTFNNQNFEQNNQEAQKQLKNNFADSSITLDTSLHKESVQSNLQSSNFIKPLQANNVLERNIFDQVMKNIQGNISAEKSEVTMILKPENLGKITLNIMNERGTVSAEFKAESKEAADALSKNIQDLKETLKQQGVICTNLVVKLEEPNRSENNMQFAQQEQHLKDFSQGNFQNSDKNSFEDKTNSHTAKNEFNQVIQEEQEQTAQTTKDNGLVDYRV